MADDEQKKKKIPTGALNVERRTWDLEHFEKIAKERLEKVRLRLKWMRGIKYDPLATHMHLIQSPDYLGEGLSVCFILHDRCLLIFY